MPDKQDAINRLEVGFVKMPTSANEAQAMVNLGIAWLEEHAPERLRASPAQLVAPGITWTENGDKTCGYNNWVGETAFGRILITWKGWKEDADASVDEFPGGLNAYGHPNEVKAACEAEFRRRIGAQQPRIGEFVDMLRRTVGPVKAWPQYRDNLFLEITALIEWHDKNLPEQQPASAVPDFAPLTRDEVRDLSAMQAGAPWDEPIQHWPSASPLLSSCAPRASGPWTLRT